MNDRLPDRPPDRRPDRRPGRLPLRRLVAELAGALGRPEAAVLGAPVAIDLRWRRDERGVFLSGVPADLVDQVGAVFAAVFDDCEGVVAEWWSVARGRGIGTGPVLVDDDEAPTVTAHKLERDEREDREEPTRLEQAQELRTRFAIAAARLEASFAVPLDAGMLLAAIDGEPVAAAAVLDDIADSRRLVGRYLLDAADELDDERVDQLGDGYVRAADLWAALARLADPDLADPDLVGQLLGLEGLCVEWMLGAAEPPTRYAF